MTLLILPSTSGAVTNSYCPVGEWQELVERKLTKAKSIYSWQKTKLTKKRGGSLTIFAVLTARTLYTYKYEVAINNDKLHRLASVFYPQNLHWNVTFRRVGRAPVRVAPVRFSLREAHLSGRPTDTLSPSGVSCPAGVEDTRPCGRICWRPARPGSAGFSFRSEFLSIFLFSVLLTCRMFAVNLTLTLFAGI